MFNYTQRKALKPVLVLCFGFFVSFLFSAEYFVTTTADDGPGSLREAILSAIVNPGPDMIDFQIPKSDQNYNHDTGVWTITPLTPMRTISDSNIVINGMTQRDFIGEDTNPDGPEIELNGSLNTYGSGLRITSNHVEIYHLIINRFPDMGFYLEDADRCIIAGCYLGVNYNAMEAAGNEFGIFMDDTSRYNMIVPMDDVPNIISGNSYGGIRITYGSCYNTVAGNYIGLNRTGLDTLGNGRGHGYGGIAFGEGSHHNEINENMIFGNRVGIWIWGCHDNVIANNCIGADRTWTLRLGNVESGMLIYGSDTMTNKNVIMDNFIGFHPFSGIYMEGEKAVENTMTRNQISNNGGSGISLAQDSNNNIPMPKLVSVTSDEVQGTAVPMSVIEVFTDPADEGMKYLGSATSEASGAFVFDLSGMSLLGKITATATDPDGNTSMFSLPYAVPTDVRQKHTNPARFHMEQNFPNPFNPMTNIQYTLPTQSDVDVRIYDMLGEEAACLVQEQQSAGLHQVQWDGSGHPSGVYFYQIQAGDYCTIKKCVLMK